MEFDNIYLSGLKKLAEEKTVNLKLNTLNVQNAFER